MEAERTQGERWTIVQARSQVKLGKVALKFFSDPAAFAHEKAAYQVGQWPAHVVFHMQQDVRALQQGNAGWPPLQPVYNSHS